MFRHLLISMFLTSTALADTWTVDDDGKAYFDNIQAAANDDPIKTEDCCEIECGTLETPEAIKQAQRMLANGTWDEGRSRFLDPRGVDTQFVKLTIHIVRYSDGTGGIPESRISTAIIDLNNHVASTGLVFFRHVNTIYLDSDQYADCTSDESYALRAIDPVSSSVNIWFVPNFIDLCGKSSFPGSGTQGIVMDNDCTATTYNHSTFTHEVGHYFNLWHTHTTSLGGAECVDGSNCSTAGDLFCDTPADPDLSGNMNPDFSCLYVGSVSDVCGSGDPYDPATDNIMSYSVSWCRDALTQEQLSMFLYTAETNRADHLLPFSTGACCDESDSCVVTYEYQCENVGWNWQGLGAICVDGCLQNELGACCIEASQACIELYEPPCVAGGGVWLGPLTVCTDEECVFGCEGDINTDGEVNVSDLLMIIDQWGLSNSPADLNLDGIVDVVDLLIVIGNWGPCE